MLTFHVFSLCVRVHIAALLLWLGAFLWGYWDVALMGVVALLCHEGSHLLVMRLVGQMPKSVELTPFGGMIHQEAQGEGGVKPLIVALSGVLGSVLLGLILSCAASPVLRLGARLSFSLAFLNLLPAYPLDGGRMLYALLSPLLGARRVLRTLCAFSYILSAGMTLLALYAAGKGQINLTLLFIAPYIGYAANQNRYQQMARLVRKSLMSGGQLQNGRMLTAHAMACARWPDEGELIRLMTRCPYPVLLFIDPVSGRILRAAGQQEIASHILGEKDD